MHIDKKALELAKTHFYTLGGPRNFQLGPDGNTLYFIRSSDAESNVQSLWSLDTATGIESLIFDPLKHRSSGEMTAEEDTQRERLRETSNGVTSYTLSGDGALLCFTYHGSLWLYNSQTGKSKKFAQVSGAFDPRFNHDGSSIAYVTAEGVWTVASDTVAAPIQVAANESNEIYFGRADFIASEEFERYRGYWWSPDDNRMIISQVDETLVENFYHPNNSPGETPEPFKYPALGTANPVVSLYVFETIPGRKREIVWDKSAFPYLLNVQWRKTGIYVTLQSRDQKTVQLCRADDDNALELLQIETDQQWVDVVQPLPYVTDKGDTVSASADTKSASRKRQLAFNGSVLTPSDQHVEDFIGISGDWLVYNAALDPKERVVYAVHTVSKKIVSLSPIGGLFSGQTNHGVVFVAGAVMSSGDKIRQIYREITAEPLQLDIISYTVKPPQPNTIYFTVGAEDMQACLVLPDGYDQSTPADKLPIILEVYGGPGHQEVLYSRGSLLERQWWANQGFAVLSVDGPGTPGRDLEWERRIYHDLISEPAAAQIAGLDEALKRYAFLDGSKVAARGWSFGGYLSAFLSVLYPDKIHASISGAPVTDWRFYDTHYTERYLGTSATSSGVHSSSLLEAVRREKASRPILLIHGLQDDNVVFANSLQLLEVLAEVNCPYQFIPLTGASHFTKQAEQRAWLLQMELEFLQTELSLRG